MSRKEFRIVRPAQSQADGLNRELPLGLIERLTRGAPEDLFSALREISYALGAEGGEVAILTTSGEPTSLIRCGSPEHGGHLRLVAEFFRERWAQPQSIGRCFSEVLEESPRLACSVLVRSGTEILAAVVWGDASSQFDNLGPLRALLLLLERARGDRNPLACNSTASDPGFQPMEFPNGYITGGSAAINSVHREILSLSRYDLPVLLIGETGVGKEHYARLVHMWSGRSDAPFVAVNCAAIPGELLEVEMFGIGRGVATGVSERPGYFQLAKSGTLFLDEIGELSLPLQAKLLRALQEREIRRLGGAAVEINARFVAATNHELRQLVRDGRFRADLYYRLAGAEVHIPPLRSRGEDFLILMKHFMYCAMREVRKPIEGITHEAVESLRGYSWPGNVRELQHEMRRLVYLCPAGAAIDATMLSERISAAERGGAGSLPPEVVSEPPRQSSLNLSQNVEELERRIISLALGRTGGNQARAAKLLGISRNGLAIKMRRLGISNSVRT